MLAGSLYGRKRDADPNDEDLTPAQYAELCDLVRRNPPARDHANGHDLVGANSNGSH
jgi:hypothetical protein